MSKTVHRTYCPIIIVSVHNMESVSSFVLSNPLFLEYFVCTLVEEKCLLKRFDFTLQMAVKVTAY